MSSQWAAPNSPRSDTPTELRFLSRTPLGEVAEHRFQFQQPIHIDAVRLPRNVDVARFILVTNKTAIDEHSPTPSFANRLQRGFQSIEQLVPAARPNEPLDNLVPGCDGRYCSPAIEVNSSNRSKLLAMTLEN
jgi:hypothetical protein